MQGIQDLSVNKTRRIPVLLELTGWWGNKVIILTCIDMISVNTHIGKPTAEKLNLFRESRKAAHKCLKSIDYDSQGLMQWVKGRKEEGSSCTRGWELHQHDFCTELQNTVKQREKLRSEGYVQMTSFLQTKAAVKLLSTKLQFDVICIVTPNDFQS